MLRQYDEVTVIDFFKELLPNILSSRTPILENEKDYVPFVVNKALSAYIDTILYAAEMNINHGLDPQMQHDYIFYSVRKAKRSYQPWLKNQNDATINAIKMYFDCSNKKAKETINTLTDDQIKEILDKVKSIDV